MEYQIGDFSRIARVSIRTLHYYQEMALVHPSRVDKESGYRYYDERALQKLRVIQQLKELDFSLKDIKEILAQHQDESEIQDYLIKKTREIEVKICHYKSMQAKLKEILKKEETVMMLEDRTEVSCKDIPAIQVVSLRYKGRYQDVGKYLGRLYKNCASVAEGAPFCLYHDGDYKEEDADIEVCLQVKKEITRGEFISRLLAGGRGVSLIHRGPYEELGRSYQKLYDYIQAHKLQVGIPSREIYLKGPGMILPGNPKNYLTELQMLLKEEV